MSRFEEYQLIFYQRELKKKEEIIEELLWENRVLARANLKLCLENSCLRKWNYEADPVKNGIVLIISKELAYENNFGLKLNLRNKVSN